MAIAVGGVYEGKRRRQARTAGGPRGNTKVRVILETEEEATVVQDADPTGWNTADELIGFMKDGPQGSLGARHDEHIYRK